MRRFIPLFVLTFVLSFTFSLIGIRVARADGSGSNVTLVAQGSGSAISTPPSDALHDPIKDPLGALNDAKAAKKSGWPILVLVLLIAITKTLAFAPGAVGKWFSTGKRAMYVAAAGGLLTAMYNALALGGSYYAAGLAALTGLIALLSPHAPPTAQAKAS